MTYAFDTLGYSKRLRDGGVPLEQAEAHAEAARDFVMAELVTKTDLLAVKGDVLAVKGDVQAVKADLKAEIQGVKADLKAEIQGVKTELQTALQGSVALLQGQIDALSLRMTVRLGTMLVGAIAVLAALLKLS